MSFFLKQRKVWLEEDCFDFILLICFDLSFVHSLIYSLIRLLNAMWDFWRRRLFCSSHFYIMCSVVDGKKLEQYWWRCCSRLLCCRFSIILQHLTDSVKHPGRSFFVRRLWRYKFVACSLHCIYITCSGEALHTGRIRPCPSLSSSIHVSAYWARVSSVAYLWGEHHLY